MAQTRPKEKPVPAAGIVRALHGPAAPLSQPRGLSRLRKVLDLSNSVDPEQVADDASSEIEQLRATQPKRSAWGMR